MSITNSQIKSSLFLENDFIETKITNSPFQTNNFFENNFFKVKNVKANNYFAVFYKNVYEKTTGFEKDLLQHEDDKCYVVQGLKFDNLKNYTKQLVTLIDKKGGIK